MATRESFSAFGAFVFAWARSPAPAGCAAYCPFPAAAALFRGPGEAVLPPPSFSPVIFANAPLKTHAPAGRLSPDGRVQNL